MAISNPSANSNNPFSAAADRLMPWPVKARLQAAEKRCSKAEETREQEKAKLSKLYHPRRQQEFDDELLLARMRPKGLALHCSPEAAGKKWRLSDGTRLEAETAHRLITNKSIVAVGDTLFAGVGVVCGTTASSINHRRSK